MGIELFIIIILSIIICTPLFYNDFSLYNKVVINKRILFLIFSLLILAPIMCFRGVSVGTDTLNYAVNIYHNYLSPMSFEQLISDNYEVSKAPVYWYSLWTISQFISDSPEAYIISESIIVLFGMMIFIYRSKVNMPLAIIVFVMSMQYFLAFNIARQFVSIVFCLNAFIYLYNSFKSKRGWLLFVLSVGIHSISLIFIIPIILMFVAKKCKIKTLCITSIIGAVLVSGLFYVLVEVFVQYFAGDLYMSYLTAGGESIFDTASGSGMAVIGQAGAYLLIGIMYIYAYVVFKADKTVSIAYVILPTTLFFSITWLLLHNVMFIDRIFMTMQVLQVVFIPYTIMLYPKQCRWGICAILFIGFLAYTSSMLMMGQSNVLPYMNQFF